jgi:membrane fusion protein, type I secretion system
LSDASIGRLDRESAGYGRHCVPSRRGPAEAQSGQTFYLARIKVDEAAPAALGGLKLVPGMPVEAFIETGERTALSYLVKPFTDQVARAFREE